MTRRGRSNWRPNEQVSFEAQAAIGELVRLWAERIERRRSGPTATVQLTHRRGRLLDSYLRGLYGRPQYSVLELADAIDAYAADPWHAAHPRAALKLTDWLDDADTVELWVNAGRQRRGRINRGQTAAQARRRAEQAAAGESARQRELTGRAEAELARLRAEAPGELADMERAALAALPQATRMMVLRLARAKGALPPTCASDVLIRSAVLLRIKARLRDTAGGVPKRDESRLGAPGGGASAPPEPADA